MTNHVPFTDEELAEMLESVSHLAQSDVARLIADLRAKNARIAELESEVGRLRSIIGPGANRG